MSLACLIALTFQQPDVLISPSGKLEAVRLQSGMLSLSSRVADRFAGRDWMQMAGWQDALAEKWPKTGAQDDLVCDDQTCRLTRGALKIAFPKRETALSDDCIWATFIVKPAVDIGKEGCAQPMIIDAGYVEKKRCCSIMA